MVLFPNCKINLGLTILRRRGDGYHDLDTVFFPLALRDALEVVPRMGIDGSSGGGNGSREGGNDPVRPGAGFPSDFQMHISGLPIPGDPGLNLCSKAYALLRADFPLLPAVSAHLIKRIPMGAGLGGGSSDGAFMLLLLNRVFGLGLSTERLLDYAARLGSDCPFFILNEPCAGGGRGEVLRPIRLDLSAYSFALVHPGIHVSTPWAFGQCTPHEGGPAAADVVARPVEEWKGVLVNDFEEPVITAYPVLRAIKEQLYASGAIYASMTGSGSSFYGIFRKGGLPSLTFADGVQVDLLP